MRDLLRSRLERRGVGPCEDTWRTALASVPAPAALVDATVRAAPLFAAGDATVRGLIPARALALSQGVLRTMMITNGKLAAALALAAVLLGGIGTYVYQTAAGEPGPALKTAASADKPPAADKGKNDKDAIQGTWQVTGVEMGGKDVSGTDEFKDSLTGMWTFGADNIVIHWKGKPEETAAYKLDPSKTPKELDVTPRDGPDSEKGKTMPAIYSLEGDVLKVCAGTPGVQARPTELVSKEGTKNLLITLKREKPDQDKPKDDKPNKDQEAIQGVWQVTDFAVKGKGPDEATLGKIKGAKWVFTADKVVVQTPGEKDAPASYTLDSSQSPKELDFTPQGGPAQQAIYSLEGDVLKICAGAGGRAAADGVCGQGRRQDGAAYAEARG